MLFRTDARPEPLLAVQVTTALSRFPCLSARRTAARPLEDKRSFTV
jgi:hypothetical protein